MCTETKIGLMWLGTWSGLCYYDGYRFTTFRSMPGLGDVLTSNRIYTLHTNYRNDVWVKAIVNGTPTHVYVCTRCLRSGKVTRAV